ncbi:MAG: MlaD family protein [Actinomycetota bacterium]
MPSIRWVSLKLAVFTLVTIAVTTWLAAVIGNFQLFSQPTELTAEFEDATGLLGGDVVKAAGVTVGRVSEIRIENGIAVVSMGIDEGVDLPDRLTAQIRFRNLVGQRMIALSEDPEAPELQGDDRILLANTRSAFDLTALFNGLRPLIRSTDPHDINVVSAAVVEALGGRSDEVESILANLTDVADVVAGRDAQLQELLDGVEAVTSDLAGRDQQLRSTLGDLQSFLGDVAATRADLDRALITLDSAASSFRRVVAASDEDIEAEVEDLATIFDAVDDRRKELRRALRALPNMLIAVERTNSYGEWGNLHLIHVCKDDLGTCGRAAQ